MIDTKNKLIEFENRYLRKHPELIQDGWTIKHINISEVKANTLKFQGVKNLTFIECNVKNIILPKDAKLINCKQVGVQADLPDRKEVSQDEVAKIEFIQLSQKYGEDILKSIAKTELNLVDKVSFEPIPEKVISK